MLLIAAGSLWLFLAAVPASCGRWTPRGLGEQRHRPASTPTAAPVATGPTRPRVSTSSSRARDESCLTCHGSTGLGATTDVENGVQYALATRRQSAAASPRLPPRRRLRQRPGSGRAKPSASRTRAARTFASSPRCRSGPQGPGGHLRPPRTRAASSARRTVVVWGNGPDTATAYAGPTVNVSARPATTRTATASTASSSRSLTRAATGTDGFVTASVARQRHRRGGPPAGDTRNYTIIQTNPAPARFSRARSAAQPAGDGGRLLAAQGPVERDEPARRTTRRTGSPRPSTAQISAWCLTCHTRYLSDGLGRRDRDAIYTYRHTSNATSRNCITCHVAHGSNAQMTGYNSATMEWPGGHHGTDRRQPAAQIDNRGTCQLLSRSDRHHHRRDAGRADARPARPLASTTCVVAGDDVPATRNNPPPGESPAESHQARAWRLPAKLPPPSSVHTR